MTSYGRTIVLFSFLAVLLGGTSAAIVNFGPCEYFDDHDSSHCTIHELRVSPCKEAANGGACRIRRKHNASIEFDYTANFAGDKLESYVYWVKDVGDVAFIGMERDACLSTPCPVVSGQKQTYTFGMLVDKSYPINSYKVKWQLKNSQGQDCCFTFNMVLA